MMEAAVGESLEIEVKFLVTDLRAFRLQLLSAGGKLRYPRTYEKNIRYDDARQGLMRQGKLLRLRQDTIARLTFKGSARHQADSVARVREEIEVEVEDFNLTAALLERIGFEERQRYEKYRETFDFESVEVVLDEMPFGDFVELEGPENALHATASKLGLDWNARILDNYLELMARLKSRFELPFDDLTFENFSGIEFSMSEVL